MLINGTTVTVKVAHVRLCHSRMLFVRAYPRETQEMVFSTPTTGRLPSLQRHLHAGHLRQHEDGGGDDLFVGRERAYNRCFMQMCSHYLVDPVACTPSSRAGRKGRSKTRSGRCGSAFLHLGCG